VLEIANRAGASKKTIYSRYPTKAGLFAAVVTRKSLELQESFAATLQSKRTLEKVPEAFGHDLMRAMSNVQLRALYKIFIGESLGAVDVPERE